MTLVRALRWGLLCGLASLAACHLYRLERHLERPYADFMSRVSWIITGQERKAFLKLPAAEKPDFIEEFWRRRDPDPTTEVNEFKDEYERRVDEAARLFRSESKSGWLTDRGRILILFGPPHDRLTNPARGATGGACTEEWYYGNFPVVFVDRHCSGEYLLETNDLTSLPSINLMYMHELDKAQSAGLAITKPQGRRLDFNASLEITTRTPDRLAGFVHLKLPLDREAFNGEGDILRCSVDVWLSFHDGQNDVVWESLSNPEFELKAADLDRDKPEILRSFELPFTVDGRIRISRLVPGASFLNVTVTLRADGRTSHKKLELK
jgi:GWxTD domain-containing protein